MWLCVSVCVWVHVNNTVSSSEEVTLETQIHCDCDTFYRDIFSSSKGSMISVS